MAGGLLIDRGMEHMLKKIALPGEEIEQGADSPTVVCEACGAPGLRHLMMNVMIGVGSPGHPSLAGFQCPETEHWACTLNCWRRVAHACLDEHVHEYLLALHATLKDKEVTA